MILAIKFSLLCLLREIWSSGNLILVLQSQLRQNPTSEKIAPSICLKPTSIKQRTHLGETLHPIGVAETFASYRDISRKCDIYMINKNYESMLRREWISVFKMIPEEELKAVSVQPHIDKIDNLLTEFASFFADKIGEIPYATYSLSLKYDAKPIFYKARIL